MKLWKKLLSVAFVLTLCLLLLPGKAEAATSGKCGDNLTWKLSSGTLTISGTGPMWDNDVGFGAPWWDNTVKKVVIKSGVTTIGDNAFNSCVDLTSVTIPEGVTYIGTGAFLACYSLPKITIPASVTYIGAHVLYACESLTDVYYGGTMVQKWDMYIDEDNADLEYATWHYATSGKCGSNLTWKLDGTTLTISGTGAMTNYEEDTWAPWTGYYIKKVVIKSGVTSIGDNAFAGSDVASVTIPSSVKTIGDGAFFECGGLKSITIPNGVTTIGNDAFGICGLTSVTIPASVTSLGSSVFSFCESLTGIWVNSGNTKYSSDSRGVLFDKAKTTLIAAPTGISGNYTIPSGVKTIGAGAFHRCYGLTGVTIPAGVTSIGDGAFFECALKKVTIPDGVTYIGESAFFYCDAMTSVTLPSSVTTIGESAFWGCESLTHVYYGGTPIQYEAMFIENDNEYLTEATWHFATSGKCGANLTWALDGTTLTISGTGEMTNYDLNEVAPWTCYTIKNVVIKSGATSIGESAFAGCADMTGVTIPSTVKKIGRHAFNSCSSLPGVTLPSGVTTIDAMAFYYCESLKSVTIPTSVTTIGQDAFSECGLTRVTIPGSVKTVGIFAFAYCKSLTGVTISSGTATIGEGAFYECEALKSVTIPTSVTTIETDAFWGCYDLAHVYYGGPKLQWSRISIGSYNSCLTGATIHYTACTTCSYGSYSKVDDTYHSRTCINCGEKEKTAHTWNGGTVTKQPTCAATGTKTYACTACSATKTETLAKTDAHTWNSGVVTKQPTCAATGIKTYTCSVCSGTRTETLSKTDTHTYGMATKVDEQTHLYICTLCGKEETLSHTWDAGRITLMPTLETTGLKEYTCTDCGATRTVVLAEQKNGDMDTDGELTTDDAVYLLLYVMFGAEEYPIPDGIDPNFDGSGQLTTDDAVYLLLHVMFGAAEYPLYG